MPSLSSMPPLSLTLMWLQIGAGFTGALTLIYLLRHLRRWFVTPPAVGASPFSVRPGVKSTSVTRFISWRKSRSR